MAELSFRALSSDEYDKIYPYMSAYGDNSCQHSFVSMYALFEKYGDSICEQNGFLYTLRSHLGDEQYRVYLAPMGGGDLKQAFQTVLDDAHRYGKKAKFITLTQRYADFLQTEFSGCFEIQEDRDLAEYVYRIDRLSTFSGKYLKKRRQEVNQFWTEYGDRASVTRMTPADMEDVLEYENAWVKQNSETHDLAALEREARFARLMLQNFEAFHLAGVVLRIDGKIYGFSFGTRLNDEVFDGLLEKGDRTILNAYKILRMELPKQCAADCIYENIEEDLGIPSLRSMKLQYQPEFLIRKFIAVEK